MVDIKLSGDQWIGRIDCDSCGLTRIQQVHYRSKPRAAVGGPDAEHYEQWAAAHFNTERAQSWALRAFPP